MNYSLYPISFTGTYVTSPQNTYTINVPGHYIAVVRDVVTGCESKTQFTIAQDTVIPVRQISAPTQTLNCFTPSVILTGSSWNNNTSYNWLSNGGTGTVLTPGPNLSVNVSANVTSTFVGTFTFQVTDNNNACMGSTIIPIYQNIIPPNAKIGGPGGSSTVAINCLTTQVVLTNLSITRVPSPPFPAPSQLVIGRQWDGPPPIPTLLNSSTYTATVPGTYTLTVQDMNNGCYSSTVLTVQDQRDYPLVNNPVAAPYATISCPGPAVTTLSVYVTSAVNLQYQFFDSGGPSSPLSVYSGAPGTGTITHSVTAAGNYSVVVTNTLNGCSVTETLAVYGCVGLNENGEAIRAIQVFPNPVESTFSLDLNDDAFPLNLKVMNTLSQEVLQLKVENVRENIPFDVPPGVYYIALAREGRVIYYSRLIKK